MGHEPLHEHEGVEASTGARIRKKWRGKSNCFKNKKDNEERKAQNCKEYANQEYSIGEKMKADMSRRGGKRKEQRVSDLRVGAKYQKYVEQ